MKKYMSYGGKKFAAGGAMPMEQLTEFNEGGRHEENSLGGIPQGMNPEGQMNLVEEGETKFDAENYIFSDTLKVDKELAEAFNLNPKTIGKTFADASKIVGRKKSKREGDAIEEAANNADLENLMEAQEAFKQARIEEKLQEIAELDPDALPALMGQGQDPNMMQDPAMGGQMQEAPMDEQAMMEQQQNMMMGQQEGMMKAGGDLDKILGDDDLNSDLINKSNMQFEMPKEGLSKPKSEWFYMTPEEARRFQKQQEEYSRQKMIKAGRNNMSSPYYTPEGVYGDGYKSGGKLPKEVLRARVESHMSPAEADAYVKNYSSGGKMPKSVLLSRAKSHMSDEAAKKYVKNYAKGGKMDFKPHMMYKDGQGVFADTYKQHLNLKNLGYGHTMGTGGYTTRSYNPGGPLNEERPVYGPITEERNELLNDYERLKKKTYESDLAANPEKLVTMEPIKGENFSLEDYIRLQNMVGPYLYGNPDIEPPEAEKLGGYLGDGKGSFEAGGYMKRSYNPGGFMAANPGMADPCPCGTPNCPPCNPAPSPTKMTTTKVDRDTDISSTGGLDAIKFDSDLTFGETDSEMQALEQDLRQNMLSNKGAYISTPPPANLGGSGRVDDVPGEKVPKGKIPQFFQNLKDNHIERRENIKAFRQKPNTAGRRYTHFNRALNLFRPKNNRIRNRGNQYFAVKHPRAKQDAQGNNLRALSNLYLGVKDKGEWVGRFGEGKMRGLEFGGDLMQPANEMRRGGKMCYGCGGAMHNYGGRLMTNYREDEEFDLGGKIARGLGTAMKTAGNLIPIPGLNTAVAMGGAALENVGTGADAKEVLKDTALAALPGVAGGLVSGLELPASVKEKAVKGAKKVAGTVAGVVQDSTADSDKSQIQRNQILESGTPEQQAEVRKQMKEEEGIAKIGSTFGNLFKPQTEEEEENQDLIARYGKKFYRAGGLWANIHAKRERIAAGSGETMREPGSKGAPTAEALKDSQNALGGRMYYPGGQMQFMPNYFNTTGTGDDGEQEEKETNEFNNMYPDISEALEKSPLEKIGMYAPIAKNLYDATLAESKDYTPDFVPAEYIEMNPAQAIQQEKQRNAAVINAARAKGFNTPSMLLALNQQLQGTVSNIQAAYDQNNAKIKQAKLDKDNAQLKELKKIEKELQMRLDEAKNTAFNEALIQGKEIAENNTANKLAALYAMMGAPDMGQSFLGGKTLRQLKKEKKELEKEIQRKEKNKKV
tara:strand:- start:23524 stop:27186 length:3663 start_codon:yes stop_codon:yes gene_type:complete